MLKQNLFRGYSIDVNMKALNKKINTKAVFNQRDYKTAMLVFSFNMDGEALDITDCKVMAKILKNDDNKVVLEAQILDAESGLVAVGLGEQALACVGQNIIELVVQYNDQQLYSPQMMYIVSDNLYDEDEIVSSSDAQILRDLLRDVNTVERDLIAITNLVNTEEEKRKIQEENRQKQEAYRQTSIENIKISFDEKNEEFNNKILEVNVAIDDSGKATLLNTKKVDDKIVEANEKINEINLLVENLNSKYDKKVIEVDEKVNEAIKSVDEKIKQINSEFASINLKIDNKLIYVDSQLQNKFDETDTKIEEKFVEVDNVLASKISYYDGSFDAKIKDTDRKITEVNQTNVDAKNKITEMNEKISEVDAKIAEVDEKTSGYQSKYEQIERQERQVQLQEQTRVDAERGRVQTFNSIIAELEISEKDIDDILGMVGGL